MEVMVTYMELDMVTNMEVDTVADIGLVEKGKKR